MNAWLTQKSFAAKTAGLVFIFLLAKLASIAQNAEVYHIHYKIDEETSASVIHQIKQDSIGFVWLATDRGIVRFDGERFKQFDLTKYAPSNEFFGISIAPDGSLWFYSAERVLLVWEQNLQTFKPSPWNKLLSKIKDNINGIYWSSDTLFIDFSTRSVIKAWINSDNQPEITELNKSINYHQVVRLNDHLGVAEQKQSSSKIELELYVLNKLVSTQPSFSPKLFSYISSGLGESGTFLFTNGHLNKINRSGQLEFTFPYPYYQTPNGINVQNDSTIWVGFLMPDLVFLE